MNKNREGDAGGIGPLGMEYILIAEERGKLDKNYSLLDELENSYFKKSKKVER